MRAAWQAGRSRIRPARRAVREPAADRALRWASGAAAASILGLGLLVLLALAQGALPALARFGPGFLVGTRWDPVHEAFGALPFVAGTLLTSALALLLAVPVALGIAVLLSEYAPPAVRGPLAGLVELLAAIPSVVYGLWGIFVLAPVMRDAVEPAIAASPLGLLPFFGAPRLGLSMLTASVILAVMVVPIVASIGRDVLLAVPADQREAALALGLTRWEATRRVVLGYGRAGVFGAVVLGLGRAMGETMAVTMVIGNQPQLTLDYFQPAYTLSAVIANEFSEATGPLHASSLVAVGLVLFALSLLVNGAARLLVGRMRHAGGALA